MKQKLTRRQFLKTAGLFGGFSLLSPLPGFGMGLSHEKNLYAGGKVTWVPSICNFCSSACDIQVEVKEKLGKKRILKIEGNPNSPLNRGKVCARGQSGLMQVYDPDRLKQPLIRVKGSKRGEWKFRVATWDEAFAYITEKLKKINPWEIAMVSGGNIAFPTCNSAFLLLPHLEFPILLVRRCSTAWPPDTWERIS